MVDGVSTDLVPRGGDCVELRPSEVVRTRAERPRIHVVRGLHAVLGLNRHGIDLACSAVIPRE